LSEALHRRGTVGGGADVLVVTQKIVSKAEDRYVAPDSVNPSEEALRLAKVTGKDPRLVELVLSESTAVVRAVPNVLITAIAAATLMANAGHRPLQYRERRSRAAASQNAMPPPCVFETVWACDSAPSRSGDLGQLRPAVALRRGQCGTGRKRISSLIDKRGRAGPRRPAARSHADRFADMIATRCGLAMGEGAEGIPAALVRGAIWPGGISARIGASSTSARGSLPVREKLVDERDGPEGAIPMASADTLMVVARGSCARWPLPRWPSPIESRRELDGSHPVQGKRGAQDRLGSRLGMEERQGLSQQLFEHVVKCCCGKLRH